MKKLRLILFSTMAPLLIFAQRGMERGRLISQDYMDYSDYGYSSSSDSNLVFYLILLGLMIIGIIWFKLTISNSRNKEISDKTIFLAHISFTAFTTYFAAKKNHNIVYKIPNYFVEEDGKVAIPQYAKCTIIEYVPDDYSYVKVKFENFPKPLFIPRWHLRTPDRIHD